MESLEHLERDEALKYAVDRSLPQNYQFELAKTIWRIRRARARVVGLQMPEGLLMYAAAIADILQMFCVVDDQIEGASARSVEVVIMGDVTYGACCVDDYTAHALSCDFLVHYGHSCLVPVQNCSVPTMYVFVDIAIDVEHLVLSVEKMLLDDEKYKRSGRVAVEETHRVQTIALAGTIQFANAVNESLQRFSKLLDSRYRIVVPQCHPLSRGEVLGCTSPTLPVDVDTLVFVADGRFHMEAMMIANPHVMSYRYDPYSKSLTREAYDHGTMQTDRMTQIQKARDAKHFGLILGTLGRQGNIEIVERIEKLLGQTGRTFTIVLLTEVLPSKLAMFESVDAWIQVACPRLSIDWGTSFDKPLLSSYEAMVALEHTKWQATYPMDYYSRDGGEWSNYHKKPTRHSSSEIDDSKAEQRAALRMRIISARQRVQEKTSQPTVLLLDT